MDFIRQDSIFKQSDERKVIVNKSNVRGIRIGKKEQFIFFNTGYFLKKLFHVRISPEYIRIKVNKIIVAYSQVEFLLKFSEKFLVS